MDSDAATIETAVASAQLLEASTGLSPTRCAILAILHAMQYGRWPRTPWRTLVAGAYEIDAAVVDAELGALVRLGVVRFEAGEPVLADLARRALDGTPADLGTSVIYAPGRGASLAELADVVAIPGGAVVVAGGTPANRLSALRDATAALITLVDLSRDPTPEILGDAARDAWLRATLLAIEAGGGPFDWLDAVAAIPARLAIAVDAVAAGEALARLRVHREATVSTLRPAERIGARAPVPPALEPLVSTAWKGMHIDAPAHRIVALAGRDPVAAARAVAAGHGVELARVDVAAAGGVVRARDAFAAHRVVWLDGTASLPPITAAALAALIAEASGIVLVPDADLPTALRTNIEATIHI